MRILWLSHLVPYPPKAGVLLRAYNLVRELSRTNTVDLVAFTQRNLLAPIYDDVDGALVEARARLEEFCGTVRFVRLPSDGTPLGRQRLALGSLLGGRAYDEAWLRSRPFREAVVECLGTAQYDVIHFDTIGLMQYADVVPDGMPIVLDHHNVESHLWARRAENSSGWRGTFFRVQAERVRRLEEQWCPRVDLNVMCSETDTERMKEIVPDAHTHVVPNGVDIDFFDAAAGRPRSPRIIFVGTLDWYPNTAAVRRIAFEIWPLLREADERFECDIIGGNPPPDLVELSARDERFHVHGFVDDIHPWLENALCYVCPIQDGGGTKLKILDALAMSKAIVADPIACEGIAVTDGQDAIFAREPLEYVTAILRLRDDDAYRAAVESRARRLAVEKYSFRAVGEDFHRVLSEITSPPDPSAEEGPSGDIPE